MHSREIEEINRKLQEGQAETAYYKELNEANQKRLSLFEQNKQSENKTSQNRSESRFKDDKCESEPIQRKLTMELT